MEKLKMHSPNFAEDNIAKLAVLFPGCVTESTDEKGNLKKAIDFDLLRHELSTSIVEGAHERYHLSWPGKQQSLLAANAPVAKTLRPCREESKDFDTTKNLFIEGDNLDVLKLIQETYLGKVKMIYIDPPYNTRKDFIYSDNFSDSLEEYLLNTTQKDEDGNRMVQNTESNGRFHSDWLSMIYSRLKLARNLLRDDGVIFISIDDNELHNIRKLLDEVFGENNFLAIMVLLTGANQSGDGVKIQSNTEYCIAYSKSASDCVINRLDKVEETLRNLNDAPTPLDTRPDMGYTIYYNPETDEILPINDYNKELIDSNNPEIVYTNRQDLIDKGYVPIRPGFRNGKLHRWRWGLDTFVARQSEVVVRESNSGYRVSFTQGGYNAPKNILKFGSGTAEVNRLFEGRKVFDFPKSTELLKRLISIGSCSESIILDFSLVHVRLHRQ
jgi:adenine-specific DNA-methyltransferase